MSSKTGKPLITTFAPKATRHVYVGRAKSPAHMGKRGQVFDGCQCVECKAAGMNSQWAPSPEWLNAKALALESRKQADLALQEAADLARITVAFCLRHRDGSREYGTRAFVYGVPAAISNW